MKTVNEKIGDKLRQYRELNGYSLNDVAKLVGKSKSTIHAYEIGKVSISVDSLMVLCSVYGTDYVNLLEDVQKDR